MNRISNHQLLEMILIRGESIPFIIINGNIDVFIEDFLEDVGLLLKYNNIPNVENGYILILNVKDEIC